MNLVSATCTACGGALYSEAVVDGRTRRITERVAVCSTCKRLYTRTSATVERLGDAAVIPLPVRVTKKPAMPVIAETIEGL